MNKQTIGTCSICGGSVTLPVYYHSVIAPTPKCERCGAVAKPSGPVIPMERPKKLVLADELSQMCTMGEVLDSPLRRPPLRHWRSH